jgi:hypothetical protein
VIRNNPVLDVPEGLDSGEFRAENCFPAPRMISSPYEEEQELIDGLVFCVPVSEDGTIHVTATQWASSSEEAVHLEILVGSD